MGRRMGQTVVDTNDIVGQCLGKYEVRSYSGSRYSNTKGGRRLRHYYNCINSDGYDKVVQRGNILKGGRHDGYQDAQ